MPEMGNTTKYIFLIVSHNITRRGKRHLGGDWGKLESLLFTVSCDGVLLFLLRLARLAWLQGRMSLFLRDTEGLGDKVSLCL